MPARGSKTFNAHSHKHPAQLEREEARRKPKLSTTAIQTKLVDLVRSGKYLYIAMGGGIRGTKTFGFLIVIVLLCRMFPRSRWAIVRKDLQTLRRNTLPSFNKIKDLSGGFVGNMNHSTWIATCRNGSEILFFAESFNIDPELERWKGLEVNGFLLEEGSELNEASKDKAIERAGSWIIPPTDADPEPKQPPPFVFFTFNPCANWPRTVFYEPHKLGTLKAPWFYLPATAADNPFIPDAVREAWKNLPPNLYARFVLGDWNFIDNPHQLIKFEWIEAAFNRDPIMGDGVNKVGADIARFGDDHITFAGITGMHLHKFATYEHMPVDQTLDNLMLFCNQPGFYVEGKYVKVDGLNMGAGVVDFARRRGFPVVDLIAGATPIVRKVGLNKPATIIQYKNIRTQMYWEFAEGLRLGLVSFDNSMDDKTRARLIADLTSIEYDIDPAEKKVFVLPKEKIKETLGRSTDYGDAVVQAYFDMPSNAPSAKAVLPTTTPLVSPYGV